MSRLRCGVPQRLGFKGWRRFVDPCSSMMWPPYFNGMRQGSPLIANTSGGINHASIHGAMLKIDGACPDIPSGLIRRFVSALCLYGIPPKISTLCNAARFGPARIAIHTLLQERNFQVRLSLWSVIAETRFLSSSDTPAPT